MKEYQLQKVFKLLGAEHQPFTDDYIVVCKKCDEPFREDYDYWMGAFNRMMAGEGMRATWCRDCQEVERAAELLTCYGEEEWDPAAFLNMPTATGKDLDRIASQFGVSRVHGLVHPESDEELRQRVMARLKK